MIALVVFVFGQELAIHPGRKHHIRTYVQEKGLKIIIDCCFRQPNPTQPTVLNRVLAENFFG